jgi:hypothetical protein
MSFKKRSSSFLDEARRYRAPLEVTSDAIEKFLQSLDCPRAQTVWMLYYYGEHAQLADLAFDPLHYLTAVELGDAYAATKFLSKFKGLSLGYDLDDVAVKKFLKFELQCKHTNGRFRNLAADPLFCGPVVWLHNEIRRKIASVLGDFNVEEIFSTANWGPGATTLVKARDASSANKFQHEAGITKDLYALFPDTMLREAYPTWYSHLLEIGFPIFQVGNKVVTVPKDATANRVIAIEPGLNLWFQKAIGNMLQRRLLRVGIDLSKQEINQNLACESSKHSHLATVDFSSASDSIARCVVEDLLPPRWFSLLDSCRSRFGQQGSDLLEWEKFSSMGNGFTFQLQSLLFYAIARCVVEFLHTDSLSASVNRVSVYGDDVIIPVGCLDLFSKCSAFYGFTLNEKKSHSHSFFRESCGAHYAWGADVKPIYLKDILSNVLTVYRLANAVRRFAHRRLARFGCDVRLRSVFHFLKSQVPRRFQLAIPETLGDGGFVENLDVAVPSRCRHGVEGYRVRNLAAMSRTHELVGVGLLLSRLWVPSSHEERNTVPQRGRTKLALKMSLVSQWYDLGPWM